MKRTKKIVSICAALLLLNMLVSCTSSSKPATTTSATSTATATSTAAPKKNSLTVVIPVDVKALYQFATDDTWSLCVMGEIFDPLWRINPKDGKLEGCLAEKWEFSADYKTCKVQLRKGVKWHNGDAFTSKDVKWTLETCIKQGWCNRWVGNFIGVDIVDDLNCVLKWSAGDPNVLKYFAQNAMTILPADYFAKVGEEAFQQKPIGTGPFILDSWTRGDRIVFKSNKNYFLGAPSYDTLTIRMIPDGNASLMALESGNVDAVCDLQPAFKDTVSKNKNLRWESNTSTMFIFVEMQNQVAPLNDIRVRKALSLGINRQQIQAVALGGAGKLAPYGISPYSPQWSDKDAIPKYDVEGAKKLLAEAGFGKGLSLSLTCRQGDFQKPAAEIVQANWKDIGVDCKVEVMEKNAQADAIVAGKFQTAWKQTTDVILDGTIWGMAHDSNYMGNKGANHAFYKNARFDELNAMQKIELDPAKRLKMFDEMKQIYFTDCPDAPGFFAPVACVVNKDLKGTYAAFANFYRFEYFSW